MGDHERLDPQIAAHYAEVPERRRLAGPGSLERIRTLELLGRWLPAPPAVVMDVGGAAGVYALPLAERGYEVHLVDPVALHVAQALRASGDQPAAPLASAAVGDARRLDRPDASVDAALLLGPLYHLTDRADRISALVEACRVLRPGGVLAAAAISRFASTYDGLLRGYLDEPGFEAMVERDVADGQHRNLAGRPEWFTTAYFHLPGELGDEVVEAGLRLAAVLAVEGPGGVLLDVGERLADPVRRERVLEAIRRVEAEPSLLGASFHLLAVAHRWARGGPPAPSGYAWRSRRATWEAAVTPPTSNDLTVPRTEDLFRHLDDLRTDSYEGAGPRSQRDDVFRLATELLDPVVTAVLEEVDARLLDGTGEVGHAPAASDGSGGLAARWSLSWPAQRERGVDPVEVVAWYGAAFTHGHLSGSSLGHWPLQVTSAADAARQDPIVRAIVEAELHQRVFDARGDWRVITAYSRQYPGS